MDKFLHNQYCHYDSDETGFVEYNISGKDYFELLETCIKYSNTVSFRVWYNKFNIPEDIIIYRLPLSQTVYRMYQQYYNESYSEALASSEIYVFPLVQCVCSWLVALTDNIFGWRNFDSCMAEDPMFFRKDGSVFFKSEIHEGEIYLLPRPDENVTSIVNKNHWIGYNDNRDIIPSCFYGQKIGEDKE